MRMRPVPRSRSVQEGIGTHCNNNQEVNVNKSIGCIEAEHVLAWQIEDKERGCDSEKRKEERGTFTPVAQANTFLKHKHSNPVDD